MMPLLVEVLAAGLVIGWFEVRIGAAAFRAALLGRNWRHFLFLHARSPARSTPNCASGFQAGGKQGAKFSRGAFANSFGTIWASSPVKWTRKLQRASTAKRNDH